ncbi:hypothetical protein [Peribacillus simplex]|uniref:Uncharacterized protein n=1 Tax=Peribacillus simplex TaxID=1478 RepID=A0AAW7IAS6_9BACI|nr:hypothetical protein [Peribacillus simplex]MDM5451050.1 hypothetical protein [Peribacillus simplex]
MSESKSEQYKRKIKEDQERKERERNARKEFMPDKVSRDKVTQEEDPYTISFEKLILELKNPEQTFGTKLDRTELIGCFFEPKVATALMKDQKVKGRGWKSHLVNELVKKYYQDKGKL